MFIECAGCEPDERRQAVTEVTVTGESPVELSLTLQAEEDVWLLVLKPRLPGWRAFVDGVPVRTAIGDGLFFAVPVSAGKHEVRLAMTYSSILVDSARQLACGCDPWQL